MSAPFPKIRRGIVAILRGVKPSEIEAIGGAIYEAGIEAIEVPLNSPQPFASIEKLARLLPDALVGAGTVLKADEVDRLNGAGGKLLVSPNVEASVMERAAHFGMVTMPGVLTPTEAFLALRLGASALKFFPVSVLGPGGINAIRAVLPRNTLLGAVGGVSEKNFADYAKAGVRVFGLGSSLYVPGAKVDDVRASAEASVAAWDALFKRVKH